MMLKKLLQRGTTKEANANQAVPKSDVKTIKKSDGKSTHFGGLTSTQMNHNIKNANSGNGTSVLSTAVIGEAAKSSIRQNKKNENLVKITSSKNMAEVIARTYSEGDSVNAIEKIRTYLNENEGAVDKRYWYMLMDSYQIAGNRQNFERVAIAFARSFGASPPSWHNHEKEDNKNLMTGKNILILPPIFNEASTENFKDFFKAAKQQKFCRINVSQSTFELAEILALKNLYNLFVKLRKFKVTSVLMGDNNLINFCKTYINPLNENKNLNPKFLEEENFFWLLYLEVLQWKGKEEEFEQYAIDYAEKFQCSAPGWEEHGVMSYDNSIEEVKESYHIDKNLNANNIQHLLEIIKEDFVQHDKSEIEFQHVERLDFASAGAISHFIQEISNEETNQDKEIIIKHPNEMILTLLEMVGVTEFVTIIPKNR